MTRMTRDVHTPDEEATKLFTRYKRIRETEIELRDEVRTTAAAELKAGATVGQLAKLTGLTPEYFRRIARENDVELKRPPTVQKISQD
jgi:hypothetical protein